MRAGATSNIHRKVQPSGAVGVGDAVDADRTVRLRVRVRVRVHPGYWWGWTVYQYHPPTRALPWTSAYWA